MIQYLIKSYSEMKNKSTYLFHCSKVPIGIHHEEFISIEQKYGDLVWFLRCKQNNRYVIGFSTNEKSLHILKLTTWKAIIDEIKIIIRNHNFEYYGMKNTDKHVRLDTPSRV